MVVLLVSLLLLHLCLRLAKPMRQLWHVTEVSMCTMTQIRRILLLCDDSLNSVGVIPELRNKLLLLTFSESQKKNLLY